MVDKIAMTSVRDIQSKGIDWFGNPLKVDGAVGPKTAWWMGILSLDSKRQEVIKLVLGYHASNIEFERTGHNDSPFVDKLFEPVKAQKKGYPWCMALASHVYTQCGATWPIYHISAWSAIEWAKKTGRLISYPIPGDLEAFLYPIQPGDTQRKGHGRIVLAYDSNTKVTAGADGNVTNSLRVGLRRDRPERYFIRPEWFTDNHSGLVFPTNMMYLDQLGDR